MTTRFLFILIGSITLTRWAKVSKLDRRWTIWSSEGHGSHGSAALFCWADMGVNENHKSQVIRMRKPSSFTLDGFAVELDTLKLPTRIPKQLRCRQWMESGFGTAVVWQFLDALIGECDGSSLRPLAPSMPAVRTGTAAIDRVLKYQTPWPRIFRGYNALSHSALDSSLEGVFVFASGKSRTPLSISMAQLNFLDLKAQFGVS